MRPLVSSKLLHADTFQGTYTQLLDFHTTTATWWLAYTNQLAQQVPGKCQVTFLRPITLFSTTQPTANYLTPAPLLTNFCSTFLPDPGSLHISAPANPWTSSGISADSPPSQGFQSSHIFCQKGCLQTSQFTCLTYF